MKPDRVPPHKDINREVKAAHRQRGTELTMRWKRAGMPTGQINGNRFTMANEGIAFSCQQKFHEIRAACRAELKWRRKRGENGWNRCACRPRSRHALNEPFRLRHNIPSPVTPCRRGTGLSHDAPTRPSRLSCKTGVVGALIDWKPMNEWPVTPPVSQK